MLTARLFTFTLICSALWLTTPPNVNGVQGAKSRLTPTVERLVHLSPLTADTSRYVYVPFDVPRNAIRINVSYQYDRANGTNTIDIGLFDARSSGLDTDPRGFRGWSGGRRSEFFVSRDEATPGYLSGEIPAGKWRIILGLYRVAPAGVDVSFRIDIETKENILPGRIRVKGNPSPSPATSSVTPIAENSAPQLSSGGVNGHGARWWRGDLHVHTVHSDGNWTVAELASSARNTGLDFIVVTDHNTASHHAEIDRLTKGSGQPLVLRGEEITTHGGHTNAWGLPSGTWIDFRVRVGDTARISSIAAQAHRAGALISINHPFVLCGGCAWSYDAAARDFDAIEVWNGPWDFTDEPALTMWDKILQSGRRITAIASSDSHRPDTPIGQPTTHVAAKVLSQAAILNAIRQGRVYLTAEAARPIVSFEAEAATSKRHSRWTIGDDIRLSAPGTIRFFIKTEAVSLGATISLISNGQMIRSFPAKTDGQPQVIEIECPHDSYFRLEVRDKTKRVLALTNPIYVKIGAGR
ncbi:MAG: PHP domain-containing protein [Pyrinomonadaceae bacterium]|nr:PHP domain-containing protein [Pyrinomonadaceae bacterium]